MKKVKIVLSFILCFILFVGAPSTAYAKTSSVKKLDSFVFYNIDSTVPDVEGDAVTIPYWFKSSYPQYKYRNYQFYSDYFTAEDSDVITISIQLNNGQSSRYLSWEDFAINVRSNNYGNPITVAECDVIYDASISTFIATGTVSSGGNDLYLSFYAYNPTLTSNSPSVTFSFGVTDITIDTKSEQSGFFDKVSDFFQGLFDRLTAWFDSLFQWLTDIRDNASEGFSNIGNWFTELGNKIKSFFTELGNNIKEQFTNMINNLKSFFADVGQWFKDIGDKIGEFFEKLWNRIWWGNENGESEYQKPVINNKFNDILDTLNGYQLQLKNTTDTINSAADSVSTYISTGTQLVNGIINVAGVGFTALIVFAIVFVLARKVVGR